MNTPAATPARKRAPIGVGPGPRQKVIVEGTLTHGSFVRIVTTNTKNGRTGTSSGIYDGCRPSQHSGEPYVYFRDGVMGSTPQKLFGFPVSLLPLELRPAVDQ